MVCTVIFLVCVRVCLWWYFEARAEILCWAWCSNQRSANHHTSHHTEMPRSGGLIRERPGFALCGKTDQRSRPRLCRNDNLLRTISWLAHPLGAQLWSPDRGDLNPRSYPQRHNGLWHTPYGGPSLNPPRASGSLSSSGFVLKSL